MNKAPFFGALLYEMKIHRSDKHPSPAWTDGFDIFLNEPLLREMVDKECKEGDDRSEATFKLISFVLMHELFHCMFLHVSRRMDRRGEVWNIAADMIINTLIAEWFPQLPLPQDCCSFDTFKTEADPGTYTVEKLYEELLKNAVKIPYNPLADLKPGGVGDTEATRDARDVWNEKCLQAEYATSGSSQVGSEPMEALRQNLEDLYAPKVDWRQHIRAIGGEVSKADFCFTRRSKASIGTPFYLPKLHSTTPYVAVAIDVSGSISEKEYKHFMSEVRGILNSYGCKIGLLQCNTEVVHFEELSPGGTLPAFRCGGGTSFEPVFRSDHLRNKEISTLIYFTDGYNHDSGFESKVRVGYPVLWVMTSDTAAPKLGSSIRYDANV